VPQNGRLGKSNKWGQLLRRLLNEFLVFHLIGRQQTAKRVAEKERVFALIETPFKFLKIAIQVLRAHLMVRTDDGPLEKAPDAFDPVRVNVSAYPFFRAVVNALMLCVVIADAVVAGIVVCVAAGCIRARSLCRGEP